MSQLPVIDAQAIENLRALSPDDNDAFLREIVGIFLEDVPNRLKELDESLAANDVGKFTRAAHSIKGASSNIGASTLRASSEQLEHRSRHELLTSLAPVLDTVKSDFALTKAELAKLLP